MPDTPTTVRSATASDAPTIVRFQQEMARLTEDLALDPGRLRKGVDACLADPDRGFYLMAEVRGEVAGSLMVTREWSDWRNGWFWWIQSVFVGGRFRRRGVYRALHDEVRRRARAEGDVIGIRLYVERDNDTAQATYRAMGMEATRYSMFVEELAE